MQLFFEEKFVNFNVGMRHQTTSDYTTSHVVAK